MFKLEKEPPGRVRYLSDEDLDRVLNECPDYLKPCYSGKHTGLEKENILTLTCLRSIYSED